MGDIFLFNQSNDDVSSQGVRSPGNEIVRKKESEAVPRRKGLVDITNLQSKQKVSDKGKLVLMCDQELIQQLRQENVTLRKQLVERNKMVELYATEIQKLRVNLQKSQQQNLQLAQAHSQMLYQLNASKDKLIVLGHELACRKNLLAVKSLELPKVKKPGQCQGIDSKKATSKEVGVSSLADGNGDKPCSTESGQNSRDIYSAVDIQSATENAMVEEDPDSRYRRRRQSSRFKSADLELAESMPDMHGVAFQSMDKRPESCPMSETPGEVSQESFVSSSADIDSNRPCSNNDKYPRKGKRGSVVKRTSNDEKFETKRPRTRLSMLNSKEQQEDFKAEAKLVASPSKEHKKHDDFATLLSPSVNTKDAMKKEAELSLAHEVRNISNLKVTLQDDNLCSNGTRIGQLRATGLSTSKDTSQAEKTETKRPCSRRQSSRLKCKDEETNGCHPQSGNDNENPENHSLQITLPDKTEQVERQETAALPEQLRRSSVGRPLRRATEKIQSYKEIPLKTKMRRPR